MKIIDEQDFRSPLYHRGNFDISEATPILHELWAMPSRCDVSKVLNSNGLTGTAAEIGVMFGHFAGAVLSLWNGKEYICVDLWNNQPTDVYKEQQSTVDYNAAYRAVMDLSARDRRVRVVKDYSVNAAQKIPNDSLDWVFIDANHSYRAVLDDMDAWWSKVKPGGVFSGHDYHYDVNWPSFIEVRPAVIRWMREHAIPFVASDSSWWAIKP